MANVCTFKMRLKGTEANIQSFLSQIQCYNMYLVEATPIIGDTTIYTVMGETRWNVTESIVKPESGTSLKVLSSEFGIEVELFGYDASEPNWIEHFHYNKGTALKEYNLPAWFEEWQVEDGEVSVDLTKYHYHESSGVYSLKKECAEQFVWDEEKQDMQVTFDMDIISTCGSKDNNAFCIQEYPEYGDSVLMSCEDECKVLNVPDGVTYINEGCGYKLTTVEELVIPASVNTIDFDCFQSCENLKKVVIIGEKTIVLEGCFSGCKNIVIYTPTGSAAETFAKEKGIPVVNI